MKSNACQIDLTAQLKERINLTSNVVNDQCESQDNVQPTNQSINNSNFNEISTNENRLLFNSTQVPISHDNQRVTIDLTTKPKKGVNIIFNPQSDNENNLGNNRHPRAKFNTSCPFRRRRGWCAKGNRCDFKRKTEKPKHLVPCPFLQKRRFCLKGTKCDFSHCATFPQSIQPTKPINYPTPSFFYDNRLPIVPQQRKPWPGYNQSAQWHPNGPGFFQFFSETANGNPFMPSLHLPGPSLSQGTVCRNTGVIPVVSANTHKIPVRITNNRVKSVANRINNHRQLKLISTSKTH